MQFSNEIQAELKELYNKQEHQTAIAFLKRKIQNKLSADEESFALYQLGKIFYYSNDFDEAEKFIQNAVKKNIENQNALLYLGLIYEKKGLYIESVKALQKLYCKTRSYKHIYHRIIDVIKKIEVPGNEYLIDNNTTADSDYPKISILILCYNNVEFTEKCLKNLFENTNYKNYEVIVLDNASVDNTADLLECYGSKIKFIHSKKNLGFVEGNNLAAQYAEGDYLVFLNNDTEPQSNWLINLYNTFIYHPDAGAAGSMLIYPDGKLQEAGGVIFNDATGWNYGKNHKSSDSRYGYLREVDYCSGASLMVRKNIFDTLRGFDTRFSPAYYEDTDLCFNVRKLGFKVYYNPFSQVIHHEGATAGTDLNSGVKKYQVLNSPKFKAKWKEELKKQYTPDPALVYKFSDRHKGKRILIIDDIPPLPDRAAGALRHYHTLKQMLNLGYKVTYVHLMGSQFQDANAIKYINEFKMRGVEFIWFNYEYWWQFRESEEAQSYIKTLIDSLDLKAREFDYIYMAFWYIADYFIDYVRKIVPQVPILVDTMDIHFLREQRQAELSNDKNLIVKAAKSKEKEIILYSKADCVTTVTEKDRDELKKHLNNKAIFVLTDVHDPRETERLFYQRKDLVFVGNFNHNPNEDAVLFFVKSIFPRVKRSIPDCKFYIVGNNPTGKIKELQSEDIIVTGWVADVKEYLDKCRIEVVPLRYGAGNKGKVGEALSNGLPIVTTSIGAEGMGLVNGEHSYIANDPAEFAARVIELYNDEENWTRFSVNGKELIAAQYSSELMRKRLKYIFGYETQKSLNSFEAINFPNPPVVSFIIPAFNQIDYTIKCIQSIKSNVRIAYEIILIDDASTDKTKKTIQNMNDHIRYIRNNENLGFPKSVNEGIKQALGEYILLLNNDTIVTEELTERMVELMVSDKSIGIIGPISNEVSGPQKDSKAKYTSLEEMHKYAAEVRKKNKGQIYEFPRVAFLCTLIRRDVINKIGGLDERFSPGNYEDDDFCLRAQLAGYKTVIANDVFVHHFGSKSFKANGSESYRLRLEENKRIFVDKWGVTPDELWLENKAIKKKEIHFPINNNLFFQYFERTQTHLTDNELELAKDSVFNALKNFSSGGASIIALDELCNIAGNICLAIKDHDNAQEYFERELNINPSSSSACKGLGDVFLMNENLQAAKTMYEWAAKNNPSNGSALEALNMVNEMLGLMINHFSMAE